MWQYQLAKIRAKGSRKGAKIQEFMYSYTTNVEPEMYDYTGTNWSRRNSNNSFKEKFGNHTKKSVNRFTTNDKYPSNITSYRQKC
jgi:hypothetical protein